MATVDSSIVGVALPVILRDLETTLSVVEWVPNAYLMVVTGLLLAFGRLADIYGHRRVYLSGLAVFTGASVLCAAAPTAGSLVAARALQGAGAAMLMACAPGMITAIFPPNQRGRGLGLLGTTVALGLTSGPSLGGLLLESAGWRSIFVVNLPVGVAAVALTLRRLPALRFARRAQTFDIAGAALFTLGGSALLLAISRLPQWGVAGPATLAWGGGGIALLAAFLVREARVPEPLLDLGLFRDRGFSAAVAAAVLSYLAGFVVVLLMPFYLLEVRGLSARSMGMMLTLPPLAMSLLAPWAGSLSDRIGYGRLTAIGMGVRALSLTGFLTLGPSTPIPVALASLALLGAGSALFNPPNTSSIMGSVSPERLGIAGGIAAVARNMGMALGIALGSATFSLGYGARGGTTLADFRPDLTAAFTAGWRMAMALGLLACLLGLAVSVMRPSPPPREDP
jgi:EmrB/QacA subfamily drug resistance transporter